MDLLLSLKAKWHPAPYQAWSWKPHSMFWQTAPHSDHSLCGKIKLPNVCVEFPSLPPGRSAVQYKQRSISRLRVSEQARVWTGLRREGMFPCWEVSRSDETCSPEIPALGGRAGGGGGYFGFMYREEIPEQHRSPTEQEVLHLCASVWGAKSHKNKHSATMQLQLCNTTGRKHAHLNYFNIFIILF